MWKNGFDAVALWVLKMLVLIIMFFTTRIIKISFMFPVTDFGPPQRLTLNQVKDYAFKNLIFKEYK